MGLPAFPLLIQNFSMMNGQCEQTNHRYRYSLSVLLRICIIPSYHYHSAPSDAAQPVMCQVVFYLHVSSHHYIQYYSLLNPKRPGPLRPEPVLLNICSATPNQASAYPFWRCCYKRITKALQTTERKFLNRLY